MDILRKMFYFCFLLSTINPHLFTNPDLLKYFLTIKSRTPEITQEKAVEDMLLRLIPNHTRYFSIHVDPSYFSLEGNMDAFEFHSTTDGGIKVCGTSGVAAAAGAYHYLKYWCSIHVSWSGDQLKLPDSLPKVAHHVRKLFNGRFRYYQNVCTASYSMAFWDWNRWEREIDWMALNGINFPLAFTGQESVWQIVYKQFGLTQDELDAHFAGPAFLAWQRMGNIDGWGGPLPSSWYKHQLKLQIQILSRMRSFGMIPVLPGFAGHIPKALVDRLYPKATYYKLDSWNSFPGTYLLDSTDPLFIKVGSLFMTTQEHLYNGTEHVYNVDVFNELNPPYLTTEYISNVSTSIFSLLKLHDSKAVWLMQGWFFLGSVWTEDLVKAWLNAVPIGKLIVLDLASDINPAYKRTHSYYGHPFIWCMIENFGGATRLYGKIADNIKAVHEARQIYQHFMIGTGLTPEGINQNYINFEIMIEMAWRKSPPNIDQWLQCYLERRYSFQNPSIIDGWKKLIHSVYNDTNNVWNGHVVGRVPLIRPKVTNKLMVRMWYDPKVLFSAWKALIEGSKNKDIIDTFIHDIVMLGTQVLEDISIKIYKQIIYAYNNKSEGGILFQGNVLDTLINDMDTLLSSNSYSLLGDWLESAKSLGENEEERNLLEYNARNQITLWGPNGEIHDYANKNWGGLMRSYYAKRWRIFIGQLYDTVAKGKKDFDVRKFTKLLLVFEKAWNNDNCKFPTTPRGDSIRISKMLIKKYEHFFMN